MAIVQYRLPELAALTGNQRKSFFQLKERMASGEVSLDADRFERFDRTYRAQIAVKVGYNVREELRASFPLPAPFIRSLRDAVHISNFVHLVNAFGNFTYRNEVALDEIAKIAYDSEQGVAIPQNNSARGKLFLRTDMHPWQIFAYSLMGGIKGETIIPRLGLTMQTLAINSRKIVLAESHDAHELGHLLFAAAHLVPDPRFQFEINNEKMSLEKVLWLVIEAYGTQKTAICSNFHLVEGLCAASALVNQFSQVRGQVQEIVISQLDQLTLVGMSLEARADQLLSTETFSLHAECVGHVVELLMFAKMFGFDISREQMNTVNAIINYYTEAFETRLLIDRNTILHAYSAFGHFRRGVTLLLAMNQKPESVSIADLDRTAYTVDFDKNK